MENGEERKGVKYPKGFAFVQFLHEESVDYAIRLLDGVKLNDRPLKVRIAEDHSSRSQSDTKPSPLVTNHYDMKGSRNPPILSPPQHAMSTPVHTMLYHNTPNSHISPQMVGSHHQFIPLGAEPGFRMDHHNSKMHEMRINRHDHPRWVQEDTRQNLSSYHQRNVRDRSPHRYEHNEDARKRDRERHPPVLHQRTVSYHPGMYHSPSQQPHPSGHSRRWSHH